VDKLIDLAQQGIDTEANIRKVTEIIENECPVIPLYIQHDLILKKSDPPKR
jgi:ABC-type oligopeptide transport system substrate-binding subunit